MVCALHVPCIHMHKSKQKINSGKYPVAIVIVLCLTVNDANSISRTDSFAMCTVYCACQDCYDLYCSVALQGVKFSESPWGCQHMKVYEWPRVQLMKKLADDQWPFIHLMKKLSDDRCSSILNAIPYQTYVHTTFYHGTGLTSNWMFKGSIYYI